MNTKRMQMVMAALLAMGIPFTSSAQTWQGSGTGGDTATSGATTLYTDGVNWSGSSAPATSGVVSATIDFANPGLVDLTGTRSLGSGAGSVGDLAILDATATNGAIQIGALGGSGSLLVSNSTLHSGLFLAQSNGSFVTATIITMRRIGAPSALPASKWTSSISTVLFRISYTVLSLEFADPVVAVSRLDFAMPRHDPEFQVPVDATL